VRGTCPVTAKNSLKAAAAEPRTKIPYWRVIKTNGELTTLFPGGIEAQAALLKKEGFSIDTGGKKPKVKNFKTSLVDFV
jgi:alkylated DNA nucleotide flippase Atl1